MAVEMNGWHPQDSARTIGPQGGRTWSSYRHPQDGLLLVGFNHFGGVGVRAQEMIEWRGRVWAR
jgi:hypothetical protein